MKQWRPLTSKIGNVKPTMNIPDQLVIAAIEFTRERAFDGTISLM
jgi:hypothetical protein